MKLDSHMYLLKNKQHFSRLIYDNNFSTVVEHGREIFQYIRQKFHCSIIYSESVNNIIKFLKYLRHFCDKIKRQDITVVYHQLCAVVFLSKTGNMWWKYLLLDRATTSHPPLQIVTSTFQNFEVESLVKYLTLNKLISRCKISIVLTSDFT